MVSTGDGVSRDTLTGILGAAVLVAAMGGVFLFERGQFQTYDVTWAMEEAGSRDVDGTTLQEGDDRTHTVNLAEGDLLDERALARVQATVTWSDTVGDADTFAVSIEGPDAPSAGPERGDGGSVSVQTDVGEAPGVTQVAARSADDAIDQAAASLDTGQGLGDWTVQVTLEDAPGEPDDGVPVTMEEADGSQAYSLTVTWDVWEPDVTG